MTLRATRHGEWPPGLHWTPGEVRHVDTDAEPPPWLVAVDAVPVKAARKPAPKEA